MSENDSERDGTETDWVANIPALGAYGFGYTKGQALMAAARYANPEDDDSTVEIQLAEHVGSLTVGLSGIRDIDELVSGETVEVPESALVDLAEHSIMANAEADDVLREAETIQTYED